MEAIIPLIKLILFSVGLTFSIGAIYELIKCLICVYKGEEEDLPTNSLCAAIIIWSILYVL